MPLVFSEGTLQEHKTCRTECSIFDVSHLGTLKVSGNDALIAIQSTFTNDLNRIAPGRAQYSHLLNDSGGVVDDVIIWWINDSLFHIMPNASNTKRVSNALERFAGDFKYSDVTKQRSVIAIQGPKSREIIENISPELAGIQRFHVNQIEYRSSVLTAAGTGYTGEDGLEISVPLSAADALWEELILHGAKPAGLGARDTLRLEAGLPLHGNELSPSITSAEANMKWVVAMAKPNFLGRQAVEEELRNGLSRKLFGLKTDGRRPPRTGQVIVKDGERLGEVTSGNYSPVFECGIAIALLHPEISLGEKVMIQGRRNEEEATVVKLPFYAAEKNYQR
tara:strand:+ start:2122 stop:3129 length:1008 start_codon:yes stop_codon:yes gene_type:complete